MKLPPQTLRNLLSLTAVLVEDQNPGMLLTAAAGLKQLAGDMKAAIRADLPPPNPYRAKRKVTDTSELAAKFLNRPEP